MELSRFLTYLLKSRIDFLEAKIMEIMTVDNTEMSFNTAVNNYGDGEVVSKASKPVPKRSQNIHQHPIVRSNEEFQKKK